MPIEKAVDWGTLLAMLSVVIIIVSAAAVYIRLMISVQINQMKEEITKSFSTAVYSKELTDSRFNEVYGRIRFLEDWKNNQ